MRWLGVMEALGGIPAMMLRFLPLPGKEVTLNGPRSLRFGGMVHTTLPLRVGSGPVGDGADEGRVGYVGLACDGEGKEVEEVGSEIEVDGGTGKGNTVTTTVSVMVSGGTDKEIVTVEASSETVLVCVVVAVAVEVDILVIVSVSVSVSVSVWSGASLSSNTVGDAIAFPPRPGGVGRSIAGKGGKGRSLELSSARSPVGGETSTA
jgi:hypothetical protein